MTNKINRCPKCKANSIIDGHYLYVKDEFILFDGKCVNCGYEVETEYPYEQLMKKFNIEKDFEHLEKPLESLLDKVKSTEEETRKRTLDCLIKLYEEKAKKTKNDEEVEKYLCKRINYQQALAGRKYSDAECFSEYGKYFGTQGILHNSLNNHKKAIEWYEKAVEADPDETRYHDVLSYSYKAIGDWGKAIEHLDIGHDKEKEGVARSEEFRNRREMNYRLKKGELLFKKGEYEKATVLLQQVSFTQEMFQEMFEAADLLASPLTYDDKVTWENQVVEESSDLTWLKNVKAKRLMLEAMVRSGHLDGALQTYDELQHTVPPEHKSNFLGQLDLNYDEEFSFFCSVVFMLLKKDIDKTFKYVQETELINCDDPAVEFLVDFLKGNIYLKYALCSQREDKERKELLGKADEYFESVDRVFKEYGFWSDIDAFFYNNWEGARYIWEAVLGSSVERILPESHKTEE